MVTPIIMSWSNTGIRGMDGRTSDGMLRGIHADLYRLESVSLRYGRPISAMDVAQNRRVCVIGAHIYDELFRAAVIPAVRLSMPTGCTIRLSEW